MAEFCSAFRLVHAVAALSLLAATVQQAHAAPVESRFSLSNLAYAVVDLQPEDGIAASFTALPTTWSSFFGKSSNDFSDTSRVQRTEGASWTLFDDTVEHFVMDNGHVSATKAEGSVTVLTQLPTDSLVHLGEAGNSLVLEPRCSAYAPGCLQDGYAYGQLKSYGDFTLTAHTKVTVTGDVALGAFVNGPEAAHATEAFIAAHPGTSLELMASSFVDITAYSSTGAIGSGPDNGRLSFKVKTQRSFDPSSGQGTASAQNVLGQSFVYEFQNDSDHDIQVDLGIVGFNYNVVTVNAVPELGTWPTMALGLVGIGVVTARRRKK